jgi:hypothetical protein
VKLAAGLFALMLLICGVSFWAWRAAPDPAPCSDVQVAQSRSPDGRALADVFEKRCGDSVATHVALRLPAAPQQARSDVFVAAGRVRVRLLWNSDRELVVESPARQVMIEAQSWRNVFVRVRRVR